METVKLICAYCSNEFNKIIKEYKRQIKNGKTKFYCGHSCVCKKRNAEHPTKGNPQYLVADNRLDKHTPFRWYVLRAQFRDRKKNYGCDLTVEYLKQLWEGQNGICPLTGWNLILPQNTGKAWEKASPNNASIDRIDNSKGYLQGNVRFISLMANLVRQSFSDEQLINFCKSVTNQQESLK